MRRFLLIALVAIATIGAAPMPIAAQEDVAENATNATEQNDDGPQGFETQVDSKTVVRAWSYDTDEEQFTLTMESEETTRVTISEAISDSEAGSGTFSIQTITLRANETKTVTMPAEPGPSQEAKISLTTSRSIDAGRGAYITTGQISNNPFSAFGGTSGLFVGVGLTIVIAAVAAFFVLRRESDGVEVA